MPDPITWYTLSRTVTDIQSVMEAIDAKVLTHNLDPSAHGQSGEGIFTHRVAALLDHVNYSIYNIKVAPTTRAFKAFVGPSATGDFETLQKAIDYVNLHGGGRIYVLAGTYVQADDITLYSNIHLIGEDDDLSIIDFNNTTKYIKCEGTAGTHKYNIKISNLKLINSANEGNFVIRFYYCDDSGVDNCFFKDNHGVDDPIQAIKIERSKRVNIENNRFDNCDYAVFFYYSHYCHVDKNYAYDCKHNFVFNSQSTHNKIRDNEIVSPAPVAAANGIIETFTGSQYLVISGNTIENCKKAAVYLENTVRSVILGNTFDGTIDSGNGIDIGNSNRIAITGNIIRDFDLDGIALINGDRVAMTGNVITDSTQYGIDLDANCHDCTATGNIVYNNAAGTIRDNGVGTEMGHNVD